MFINFGLALPPDPFLVFSKGSFSAFHAAVTLYMCYSCCSKNKAMHFAHYDVCKTVLLYHIPQASWTVSDPYRHIAILLAMLAL